MPMRRSRVPVTSGHLRRFVQEIRKPVETPARVADTVGTISRRPLSVALSRRTAWKYSGMLKRTALTMMAARKLQNITLARGLLMIILRGMMGSVARVS